MKEKVSNHLSKNWYHWILGIMLVIQCSHLYGERNNEDFVSILSDSLILLIWVYNWYITMRLHKISQNSKDLEIELWRNECHRLYDIVDEQNKRDMLLLKLLKEKS